MKRINVRKGWKLHAVDYSDRNGGEIRLPNNDRPGFDGQTIELCAGGSDRVHVFVDEDATEDYMVVVAVNYRYGYIGCEEYLWSNGKWMLLPERHYFFSESHVEEVTGPRGFELQEETIVRRLLEFMHDRF